ncbi:IclR family transcriptional regulator [Nonomuraea sp. LPB2021202275-12-8]|uniref:IclR family transcriptional regulator n=1 Tax=Nonomuraea sp. LPB2021202275-12-8 TaxID=3120159 RepID=UPI00300D5746
MIDTDSVLGKVKLILEAFRPDEDRVALAELARRTRLSKATIHRICQDLIRWGALERAGNGYRLGLRLFELGQRVSRPRTLREAAFPCLEDLAGTTKETVHCAIRDGHEVVYIEKIGGYRPASRPSRTGGRLPLHCTATGKVLLAFATQDVIDEVLSAPMHRFTPHTITSPRRLRAELAEIRASHVAVESQECRIGYLSVAAPVFGGDGLLAGAISVAAPTSRASRTRLTAAVRTTAATVTRRLTEIQTQARIA